MQLEAFSSHPLTCYMAEKTDSHFLATFFRVVVEMVAPHPPFLQSKQPQLPELFLIGLVFQSFHPLCCLSLDKLQHLLEVSGTKLNTGLKALC